MGGTSCVRTFCHAGSTWQPEEDTLSGQPTRYQNYPPEPDDATDTPDQQRPEPAPIVRSMGHDIPTWPATAHLGRRGAIGRGVAVSVAGVLGLIVLSQGGDDELSPGAEGDPNHEFPSANPGDAGPKGAEITVGGRYSVIVPDGWEYVGDGGGGVQCTNGANRVAASSIEVPPSTRASEQVAVLAKSHRAGFTGPLDDLVDRSTSELQRASLAGSGRFEGKAARLVAELWIDETGSGLLVTRILTAKASSRIAAEAQGMTNELGAHF